MNVFIPMNPLMEFEEVFRTSESRDASQKFSVTLELGVPPGVGGETGAAGGQFLQVNSLF